jgi:hypothetical protein
MKKISKISVLALLTINFLIPMANAGFGLGDLVKGAIGGLTADSLDKDLNSGLDFFAKANVHYAAAVLPAEEAAKVAASLNAQAQDKKTKKAAVDAASIKIDIAAKELIAKGEELSDSAKKEIELGDQEMSKGVAKWTAIGTAIGVAAAQKNGQDAALVAAIPAALELVKELPQISKALDQMGQLKKIKKSTNNNLDEAGKANSDSKK